MRTTTYALFPLPIPRPHTGQITTTMTCGHCSDPVQYTVRSVQHIRRHRSGWVLCIICGLACGLTATWYGRIRFIQWLHHHHSNADWPNFATVIAVCISVLLVLISTIALAVAWFREAIELRPPKGSPDQAHTLRPPGSTTCEVSIQPPQTYHGSSTRHRPGGK